MAYTWGGWGAGGLDLCICTCAFLSIDGLKRGGDGFWGLFVHARTHPKDSMATIFPCRSTAKDAPATLPIVSHRRVSMVWVCSCKLPGGWINRGSDQSGRPSHAANHTYIQPPKLDGLNKRDTRTLVDEVLHRLAGLLQMR